MQVIILGAGVAGLSTAIALTKWMNDAPNITILELRQTPSTIGGAIGLTPNALHALHHLGVLENIQEQQHGVTVDRIELFNAYTGGELGRIDFTGLEGNGIGSPALKGLRIMRTDLLQSLLKVVRSLDNLSIQYGVKTTAIAEAADTVSLTLDNGKHVSGELLIGCDGIHSVVRSLLIEPERRPTYTGIAAVYGFADLQGDKLPWQDTGLCQSRQGSLLGSYYEPTRSKQYAAAIMETPDVQSRGGWLAKGAEQHEIKNKVKDRYGKSAIPGLDSMVDATHDWTLYPVYKLGPKGTWCTSRAIILGDAAHAMPPQGESTGLALEDAITFARAMTASTNNDLPGRFAMYERIRRPRVNKAYDEATWGWDTQKDSGWFTFQLRTWITPLFLWWTATSRLQRYSEDLATAELEFS